MSKPVLVLQPSEGVLVQSAATIYAAYITAGRVEEGQEPKWLERAVREAYMLATITDESYQSDKEFA